MILPLLPSTQSDTCEERKIEEERWREKREREVAGKRWRERESEVPVFLHFCSSELKFVSLLKKFGEKQGG